jgi:hypothetical protein
MSDLDEMEMILRRIRKRGAANYWPIGSTVMMTAEGLAQFPKYKGRRGTIVGHFGTWAPKVLWDGRKTADHYAPWFIRTVKRAEPTP